MRKIRLISEALRGQLSEMLASKTPTNQLPPVLKDLLRKMKFKGRSVYMNQKDQVEISASMHAPEFDNFDYSYYLVFDTKTGRSYDPRQGMERMGKPKTLNLDSSTVVVRGDQHSNYLSITVHPTFGTATPAPASAAQ
jgi:hypothetical protein